MSVPRAGPGGASPLRGVPGALRDRVVYAPVWRPLAAWTGLVVIILT